MTRSSTSSLLRAGVCALVLALSAGASHAADNSLVGGLILNPEGLYTTYTRKVAGGDSGARLSLYDSFLFYSNEFGVQAQYITTPAVLEIHTELGFEPGFFRRAGTDERRPRWRANWRTQANLNLKLDSVWLYSRTTALMRYRNFVEQDSVNQVTIEREWSLEQATAPFVRLLGTPDGPGLWTYVEHTVGAIADHGTRTHRLSAGLLTENWLGRGTVLNLDFFWSLAEPNTGPGTIFVYYLYW
jgi:hypothetical protein